MPWLLSCFDFCAGCPWLVKHLASAVRAPDLFLDIGLRNLLVAIKAFVESHFYSSSFFSSRMSWPSTADSMDVPICSAMFSVLGVSSNEIFFEMP